ncbi:MAG TPA: hypothetical protein PLD39_09390, partial [Flexilinea sp.]|nr:hypothetical protein [Flexilinea sp.]
PITHALFVLPIVNSLIERYYVLARPSKIFIDITFKNIHFYDSPLIVRLKFMLIEYGSYPNS